MLTGQKRKKRKKKKNISVYRVAAQLKIRSLKLRKFLVTLRQYYTKDLDIIVSQDKIIQFNK